MVRHQGLEPRTNGLRVQCNPLIYAGYTLCVHQDVSTAVKFVFLGVLGSNDAGCKVIYLGLMNASKKWGRSIHNWKVALNHFAILFEACPAKL